MRYFLFFSMTWLSMELVAKTSQSEERLLHVHEHWSTPSWNESSQLVPAQDWMVKGTVGYDLTYNEAIDFCKSLGDEYEVPNINVLWAAYFEFRFGGTKWSSTLTEEVVALTLYCGPYVQESDSHIDSKSSVICVRRLD
jgi:hypothetical protein